jgi:sporulation related protein
MAENDQRSYRDPSRWRGAEEAPRAQADDPLAELARFIGQSVPMDRLGRDRRPAATVPHDRRDEAERPTSYPAPDHVLREPDDERYSAAEDGHYQQDVGRDYRAGSDEHYEPTADASPAPPPRATRFRQEPNFAAEPTHEADDGAGEEFAYQETADGHGRLSDEHDYRDEYEDERHDADDQAYDDEYAQERNTGRRGGFIVVAAVFALAVLGTAGAFAYRTMFGGAALPALPPIIKAEGGPNKIVPSGISSQDAARDDANNTRSPERLVSREERPVDIPPPVTNTAPRPVATVPVFPDPPPLGRPGAIVGYSAGQPSSNPATPTEPSPVPTASAITTASAPNQVPSAAQAPMPSAAPPVSTATPVVPAAPGPKKVRTVTIRSDQSAPDGTAGASTSQAAPTRPEPQSQTDNGPLSIVPTSTEGPAPAARPRTVAPRSVPLNKPPANETASAAPVATASGGYTVQVSSQHSEEEAQSSFRALQAKYPNLLGGHEPIIRRADLGAKGIYYRAMVGPFASADQATELCSNLKAAGGSCLVQKN